MQYTIPIFLGLFILAAIARPFTILFHELGHAIPAMAFSKKGAVIFIGSYGDKKQSVKITLGSLNIWFRYNPIKWHGGLCIPKEENFTLNEQFIYVLCGALFSLFIAAILFFFSFVYNLHGSIKLICVFAFGSTILDLFSNLIPRKINGAAGNFMYSDGFYLLNIRKQKKYPNEYELAINYYNNQEYDKAIKIFESFINNSIESEDIYRLAYTSNIFIAKYEKAKNLLFDFEEKYGLTSDDYYNWGLVNLYLDDVEECSKKFKKSLELNPKNEAALNGYGYDLNTKNDFKNAISYFEKAIQINPKFAYAYNNLGHAKIETGQLEEGLNDIKYSMELDKTNSYAHRNLGIYYLKVTNYKKALELFVKAKEMDKTTALIEELINNSEKRT
jgi:hypothetical protein